MTRSFIAQWKMKINTPSNLVRNKILYFRLKVLAAKTKNRISNFELDSKSLTKFEITAEFFAWESDA